MAKKKEEKETPTRFEGMTLSGWQRFSNIVLGRFMRKKAREDGELKQLLAQADIRIMPEVYKATSIMSTAATFVVCVVIIVLAFFPLIGGIAIYENQQDPETVIPCIEWAFWNEDMVDETIKWSGEGPDGETVSYGACPEYETMVFKESWKTMLVLGCGILIPYMAYRHFMNSALREKNRRGYELEKFLPYVASYTAAMAAANSTPDKIFKSLAQNEHIYGDIAYDSSMIYRDIQLLGMDLVTALKLAVQRAASPWVTEFFQGMVGTLTSGGNLKLYFLNRAEHYMRENRVRLHVFLESLAMMAESYVVVAVAMPLFLIVMLVIMFWVSGSGAQLSEEMVYGVVMGVLPVIHIAYGILVWMMSDEMKM